MKKVFFLACILFGTRVMADGGCGENCVPKPTCEDLGYERIENAVCAEGYVICPFDSNYVWCRKYACSDGGLNEQDNPSQGKVCVPTKFHGLDCFDCSQDLICRWTKYNSGARLGHAMLSSKCQNETYNQCKIDYDSIWMKNQGSLLKLPENAEAVDYDVITACGEQVHVYNKWKCKEGYKEKKGSVYTGHLPTNVENQSIYYSTQNVVDIIEVSCEPLECIRNCSGEDHPEGFIFIESAENSPCGICQPRDCPSGFKVVEGQGCESNFATMGYFYGNKSCGQCKEKNILCVDPYIEVDGYCECAKERYTLDGNGKCVCDAEKGYVLGSNGGCECAEGYVENNGECVRGNKKGKVTITSKYKKYDYIGANGCDSSQEGKLCYFENFITIYECDKDGSCEVLKTDDKKTVNVDATYDYEIGYENRIAVDVMNSALTCQSYTQYGGSGPKINYMCEHAEDVYTNFQEIGDVHQLGRDSIYYYDGDLTNVKFDGTYTYEGSTPDPVPQAQTAKFVGMYNWKTGDAMNSNYVYFVLELYDGNTQVYPDDTITIGKEYTLKMKYYYSSQWSYNCTLNYIGSDGTISYDKDPWVLNTTRYGDETEYKIKVTEANSNGKISIETSTDCMKRNYY